jgi:hypothetical protein
LIDAKIKKKAKKELLPDIQSSVMRHLTNVVRTRKPGCKQCDNTHHGCNVKTPNGWKRISAEDVCKGYVGEREQRACILREHSISLTQIVEHLKPIFPLLSPKEIRFNAKEFMRYKNARPLGKSEEENAKTENRKVIDKNIHTENQVQLYNANFKPVNPHGKQESGKSYKVYMGYELVTDNANSSEQAIPHLEEEKEACNTETEDYDDDTYLAMVRNDPE